MPLLLTNARLIEGTGAPGRDNAALLIEGDTIARAGRSESDHPSPAIPGLVEAHPHLSYNDVRAIADLDLNCPPEYSTLVSARNAELVLRCGYPAARSAGSVHAVDVAVTKNF
jgi:imidazolonepropionase-like amidohydrolase